MIDSSEQIDMSEAYREVLTAQREVILSAIAFRRNCCDLTHERLMDAVGELEKAVNMYEGNLS